MTSEDRWKKRKNKPSRVIVTQATCGLVEKLPRNLPGASRKTVTGKLYYLRTYNRTVGTTSNRTVGTTSWATAIIHATVASIL